MIFEDEPRAAPNLADEHGGMWRVLENHQKQIDSARKEIEALKKINAGILDHLGLMVGDYYRIHEKPEPKRTIKGGWVNVYPPTSEGIMCLGAIYPEKSHCDKWHDSRIACIQIPDITEGEGL